MKLGRREVPEELRHCQSLPLSSQVVDAFVASPMVILFRSVHERILAQIEIPDDDGPVRRPTNPAAIPVLDDEPRPFSEHCLPWDHSDTVGPLIEWPLGIWRRLAQDPKAAWHDERQCNGGIHTYDGTQKRRRKSKCEER